MKPQRKLGLLVASMVCLVTLGWLGQSQASSLLFDRGLPVYNSTTNNLNGTTNPNRSNTAPGQTYGSSPPSTYWIGGDDFSIGHTGQSYHIDYALVWMTSGVLPGSPAPPSFVRILAGAADRPLTEMTYFSPDSITPVQYSNGADYQRYPAGDWRQLWQIRVPINLGLEGGQKIRFFLDGLFLSSFDLNYHSPNLHASNAALSNTTQDGADNTFHWLTMINGVPDSVYSQYNFNYGGIIGADANIQIYGSEVPLPCALLLLGSGLAGLAGLRLRNKLKNL